jgi:hypothetical protein
MKKLNSSLIGLLTFVTLTNSAMAQESVNPGDDPNLSRHTSDARTTEAGVGAIGNEAGGFCLGCEINRLANARLHDNTTSKTSGGGTGDSKRGTQ